MSRYARIAGDVHWDTKSQLSYGLFVLAAIILIVPRPTYVRVLVDLVGFSTVQSSDVLLWTIRNYSSIGWAALGAGVAIGLTLDPDDPAEQSN